jgi:hypothetical protein
MAICPICELEVAALDKTGDADGFDCPLHSKFKVASSVFADAISGKNPARDEWETALEKATARTRPGDWPLIKTTDF